MMCLRIGRSPISTIGLGRDAVSSDRRVPSPPARITTFTRGPRRAMTKPRRWRQCIRARSGEPPRYTRPAMTHVFVAPHPDDVALSCGGLIAGLRELGQSITIPTVYSGTGDRDGEDTDYQREALGFGTKAHWPNTEAFNRS